MIENIQPEPCNNHKGNELIDDIVLSLIELRYLDSLEYCFECGLLSIQLKTAHRAGTTAKLAKQLDAKINEAFERHRDASAASMVDGHAFEAITASCKYSEGVDYTICTTDFRANFTITFIEPE